MVENLYTTGWIKTYRSLYHHWIFNNEKYLKAWLTILFEANFKEEKVIIEGELILCKVGQKLYSLKTWTKIFGKGWSVQKVRTFFRLLEKDSMIETKGLRKTTLLTVCNYEKYQNGVTDRQHTDNTQITRRQQQLKNDKNDKNEKKIIDREKDFAITLTPFVEKYGEDMMRDFYNYWKEPNKSRTRMRWELEKTWDIAGRLRTWDRNQERFRK